MEIKIEGKVFDRNTNIGIKGIKIILVNESGQLFRTETDKNGCYCFFNIRQMGIFKIIECGSENFDLENVAVKCFKNSTSKKYYEFEVTKKDLSSGINILNMDFSHDNDNGLFSMKNHERAFISPIGDAFFIDTFSGVVEFKSNVGVEFLNLNYNQVDKQYYFIKGERGIEIFRVSGESKIISIGKVDELEKLMLKEVVSDISIDGILYFMGTISDRIYAVSLNQNRIDFARCYTEINNFIELKVEVEFSAFTHNIVDGNIYGVEKGTNVIKRIDILNGDVIEVRANNQLKDCEISIMFSDELGYIYVIDDLTGKVYKISLTSNEAIVNVLSSGFERENSEISDDVLDLVSFNDISTENIASIIQEKKSKKVCTLENGIANGRLYKNIYVKSLELLESTKKGILSINKTNGGWTYIPNDDFEGIDIFRVCIIKENNESEEVIVEINSEKSLEEISVANMLEYDTKTYSLLNNAIIRDRVEVADNGVFNYSIKKGGKKGIVQIDRNSGEWTYEPYYGVSGQDQFDILISNRIGGYRVENICLDILSPKLYIEQIADKESISFDDIIEYKIFIRNTGNVKSENVIIREILDTSLSFEKGSLEINGIEQAIRSPNFIEIGDLNVNDSVEISFRAYLNKIIEQKDNIESMASVRGEFKLSEYEEARGMNFDSNLISTNILYGNISCEDIVFIADKSVTTIDDTINFKVSFKNNGNTNIQKLLLKNLVTKGTMFEKDKISINNEEFYFDIGTYGIILDGLAIGETVSLEYSLKVIDTVQDILDFTPTLEYEYLVDYRKKVRKLLFNTLSIANVTSKIEIQKHFDVDKVIVGDRVKCYITINNIGNINAKNIILKEILDEGIIYDGNLTINGEKSDLPFMEGLAFPVLAVGQSIHIAYESIVDICPTSDLMNFVTDISYNYMVCSKLFEINNQEKAIKLKILKYDLKVETFFSKEKIVIGEEFELEVNLINCEDISLNNVVMSCPLLNEVKILNIQINKRNYESKISSNIEVGFIEGREKKQIIMKLKAERSINLEKLNYIEIEADIEKDLKNISKISGSTKIDKFIEIFNPKLVVDKFIDKEYVAIGDEIEMKIIMKNVGDLILENIVLTDLLPNEFEFIEESVIINNKAFIDESIISGITIERLGINESREIKCRFKAIDRSDEDSNIMIKAFAMYNYMLGEEVFGSNIESNSCKVNISKIDVEIQKKSDKDFVKLGDEVTFDIKIINTGVKTVLNMLFIDELFEGLELVNRSFSIDGEFINNVNVKKGIIIGDIKAAGIKRISYKVKIVKTSSKLDINTKTYVKYSYVLSDGSNGRKVSELKIQDTKNVDIALSNFRQIDKDEYLKIPNEKPDIGEIDGVSASIEVVSTHIIKTPIVSSIEGQILTGYKLLINGYISETIEYTSEDDSQVMYSINYEMPFSDYIILPVDFNINSRVEVEGKVENIYYKKLNKREFFNNATLLLVAKILSA